MGPVRVWRGDRELALGPPQQRAVLVALAARANRTMSRSELIEAVWGDNSPASATSAAYTYIAGLRQVLEPEPEPERDRRRPRQVLIGTPSGYSLRLQPGAIDTDVFHQHVDNARQSRLTGDLDEAIQSFNSALALWHGTPFSGVPGPFAAAERMRVTDMYWAAVEEHAETTIAAGRHTDVASDLVGRIHEQPLRERLCGLLMLALYRSGRQAEALAVFQDARRLLVQELGIEPGPDLQRLHHQILTSDAVLQTPILVRSTATSMRPALPRQLPAGVGHFVNRTDELRRLSTLMDTAARSAGTAPISMINGAAGIGKTALAVHFGHQVADEFGDGQLYVNLRGYAPEPPVSPTEALGGFLRALGVDPLRIPNEVDEQAALYRSLLAGTRTLVVLDNARSAQQVRPLLPASPSCLALVTSRHPLTGLVATDDADVLDLDVLGTHDAVTLLTRIIGERRVHADPKAAIDLAHLCAHLPLALRITAANLATHPQLTIAEMATRVIENRLSALQVDDDPHTAVRAAFDLSYATLGPEPQRLFRYLGLAPGPDMSLQAAAALTGDTVGHTRQLLDSLAAAHLIEEHTPGRYLFHDLLRAYAIDQVHTVDTDTDRHTAEHRILDFYLHTAHAAARLLDPHWEPIAPTPPQPGATPAHLTERGDALAWCETEYPVLLAAVALAAETGFDTHAWQIPSALRTFLDRQGRWDDYRVTLDTALAAARRSEDLAAQAATHLGLGYAYAQLRVYDNARTHLLATLDLCTRMGDRMGQAGAQRRLGWMFGLQGRYREAQDHAQRALDVYQTTGHRAGQAKVLNDIGWYQAGLGNHHQALDNCQRALDLQRELGDRISEADTQDSLGYTHHHLGNYPEAIASYQRAIDLYREVDDRSSEADTLTRLGETHHTLGDNDAARDAWRQALTILEDQHHPDARKVRAKLSAAQQSQT
jgi:DNA-binding SARP family transcriptional activator/tetratricopeptide (TPR) repeat protein